MLGELTEITMGVARAVGKLALDKAAEGDAEAAGRLGAVIAKVGRAVRQSIAYRRRIEDEVRKADGERAADAAKARAEAGRQAAIAKRGASVARRQMIDNAVSRLIAEQNEDLFDAFYERLKEYESLTDFTDRPVSAFVSDICNALGLEFDWRRFAYDPWAVEEAAADPPASPFAEWWHSADGDEEDDSDGPPEFRGEVHANGHGPPWAAA